MAGRCEAARLFLEVVVAVGIDALITHLRTLSGAH